MNCSPKALLEAAKCLRCLPVKSLKAISVYLACQWAKCKLPAAPGDLGVVAGYNQNKLTWTAVADALYYNVKRSLVAGGPYTTLVATILLKYTDATAVNGTTYYYVVSAVNACGEGANSIESSGTPAIPENPLATSFATRVVANGGAAISAGTRAALSTFGDALDTAGLTAKMIAVNCIVPDNLIAAITPLIVGPGFDPWTNNNFAAGDLTINGLKGNAVSAYLNTGVRPTPNSALTKTSAGLSGYIYEKSTAGAEGGYLIAGTGAAVLSALQLYSYAPGGPNFGAWSYTATGVENVFGPGPISEGFSTGSRLSSTLIQASFANSTNAFSTLSGNGTAGSFNACTDNGGYLAYIYAFAYNDVTLAAGPKGWSNFRASFLALHEGLTSAESQTLYNAVQAMRVAIGGGYR